MSKWSQMRRHGTGGQPPPASSLVCLAVGYFRVFKDSGGSGSHNVITRFHAGVPARFRVRAWDGAGGTGTILAETDVLAADWNAEGSDRFDFMWNSGIAGSAIASITGQQTDDTDFCTAMVSPFGTDV